MVQTLVPTTSGGSELQSLSSFITEQQPSVGAFFAKEVRRNVLKKLIYCLTIRKYLFPILAYYTYSRLEILLEQAFNRVFSFLLHVPHNKKQIVVEYCLIKHGIEPSFFLHNLLLFDLINMRNYFFSRQ